MSSGPEADGRMGKRWEHRAGQTHETITPNAQTCVVTYPRVRPGWLRPGGPSSCGEAGVIPGTKRLGRRGQRGRR